MFDRVVASMACRAAISCGVAAATRPFSLCAAALGAPAAPRCERVALSQDDRACAASMGKKSRRARGGGRLGGHQPKPDDRVRAGRTVKIDLHQALLDGRARLVDEDEEAGTFTRASEETPRQRRIVSAAERSKGGGASAGNGAATQDLRDDEIEDLEAHLEKLEAELERNVHERDAAAAHHKELLDGLLAQKLPPPPPAFASKPVQDPRAISVAVAVAKAAAKAIPPHQHFSGNARYNSALAALGDTMLLDEADRARFCEYLDSLMRIHVSPEPAVDFIACWPRLRKDWPRMRRRICSYCGKGSLDISVLSKPRLLVCGGCGEGNGVARYCSEECQRAHWPEHQKQCYKFHALPTKLRPVLGNKSGRDVFLKDWMENRLAGLTLEEAVAKYANVA